MSAKVFKSYKILKQTSPETISLHSKNLVTEPVDKLTDLNYFVKLLDRNQVRYTLAEIVTEADSNYGHGQRHKRAFGLFSLGGEIQRTKAEVKRQNKKHTKNKDKRNG